MPSLDEEQSTSFIPHVDEFADREAAAQAEINFKEKQAQGQIEGELNPEIESQAVEPEEEDKFSDAGDVVRGVAETALQPVLGVADFASDAIGLVPWLKPIDQWWDDNSYRSTHPGHKLLRDASSVIIPSLVGGAGAIKAGMAIPKAAALPSYIKTLGSVAAWTGADTAVAAISSHSKTDDNMAATLNNWLGWDIPWATRASDSPDVRWKKNVYEAAGLAGGVELLGAAFAFGRKTKLLARDEAAQAAIDSRAAVSNQYDNPLTEVIEEGRAAKEAAELDEMRQALDSDPDGTVYNAFVNDLGPDDAGKATINTQPDPLMAKVNHAQIQNNLDTANGRAAAVVNEAFNRDFLHAIDGNSRANQLDQLFTRISPNFDAVVNGKTITAEQMNRSVDNLTNAIFGADLPLKEFEFVVDDMKTTVFNSSQLLDEEQWTIASQAFKNAYNTLFDPNQMRASALLTQQAADNVADAAKAVKMLGDEVDTVRQHNIILDKMNLLGQEVEVNRYIVGKAKEWQRIKATGEEDDAVKWMNQQGGQFDEYIRHIKVKGNKLNDQLKKIANENPAYYKPFIEAYDATNGKVDDLYKLKRLTENNVGFIKKAFVDAEPEVPSQFVKQLHAARINGLLSGMAPIRALTGNTLLTAIKPVTTFAGALAQGDMDTVKRAMWVYGGISENFKRGLKVMKDEWRRASLDPEEAMLRGRADLRQAKIDELEYMESMAEGWRTAKEPGWRGKVALWNMTKGLSWWNKQHFVRWGTNALYAIDGMTNSFMASGMARAKAYDELFDAARGAPTKADFRKLNRDLYSEAFDETGLLTDQAAKFASQEVALNLDNAVVNRFEKFIETVPAARGIFLFPRTGINAAELAWSFNPMSALGLATPRVKSVFKAVSKDDMIRVLKEHNITEYADVQTAFQALKSEYLGRQIMGSTIAMSAGVWAMEGNLTGNGPQDGAERQRMMRMGWQPLSIRNPLTGKWHSYKGFEPFQQVLGLTADMVYYSSRVDQAVTEDWFRKLSFSISMNVTNNTFVGGFEPLAGLLTGDPTAWNRFWAQQVDQTIVPFKGVRTILNNAISPQLRDVENDFMHYVANGSKFMFSGAEQSFLPNLLDVYTGKPIRGYESMTQAANAILPFFKVNADVEPWRRWLLATGWDGLQRNRINKHTGEALSAEDRHYINNWIAKNAGLKHQIIALMNTGDDYFMNQINEYAKKRGLKSQRDYPVKEFFVHKELDRIHDRAFDAAWMSLETYKEQFRSQGRLRKMRDYELQQGKLGDATKTQQQILDLQQMYK